MHKHPDFTVFARLASLRDLVLCLRTDPIGRRK